MGARDDSKPAILRPVEWLNFFLADVQTGLGPFLAAYLAASGWNPGSVGYVLTFGGLVTVAMQTPAGAVVDAVRRKRTLLSTAFLFHLANAAMLPQLGEMLSKGNPQSAAPFMSACIVVTQLVISLSARWIGKFAGMYGRKPLLLLGFGVLPIRGLLYTLTHSTPLLIAIQTLDGVANAIFGVVSILVISDITRGTGRFNLAAGSLATLSGLGAALSATIGGQLIQRVSYTASFLGLAGIALVAVTLLGFAVPETLPTESGKPNRV